MGGPGGYRDERQSGGSFLTAERLEYHRGGDSMSCAPSSERSAAVVKAAGAAEYRVVRGNPAKPWNPICPMLFRSMSMAAGDVSYGAALAVRKKGN